MANHVYPELVRAIARAELPDLVTVAWTLQCMDGTLLYDPTHTVLANVTGAELGDPLVLPTVALIVGAAGGDEVDLDCDDSALLLTGIASIDTVESMVVYIDTGNPATSTLGAFLNRRADTSPVLFDGTGSDVVMSFPVGYFIRL